MPHKLYKIQKSQDVCETMQRLTDMLNQLEDNKEEILYKAEDDRFFFFIANSKKKNNSTPKKSRKSPIKLTEYFPIFGQSSVDYNFLLRDALIEHKKDESMSSFKRKIQEMDRHEIDKFKIFFQKNVFKHRSECSGCEINRFEDDVLRTILEIIRPS